MRLGSTAVQQLFRIDEDDPITFEAQEALTLEGADRPAEHIAHGSQASSHFIQSRPGPPGDNELAIPGFSVAQEGGSEPSGDAPQAQVFHQLNVVACARAEVIQAGQRQGRMAADQGGQRGAVNPPGRDAFQCDDRQWIGSLGEDRFRAEDLAISHDVDGLLTPALRHANGLDPARFQHEQRGAGIALGAEDLAGGIISRGHRAGQRFVDLDRQAREDGRGPQNLPRTRHVGNWAGSDLGWL